MQNINLPTAWKIAYQWINAVEVQPTSGKTTKSVSIKPGNTAKIQVLVKTNGSFNSMNVLVEPNAYLTSRNLNFIPCLTTLDNDSSTEKISVNVCNSGSTYVKIPAGVNICDIEVITEGVQCKNTSVKEESYEDMIDKIMDCFVIKEKLTETEKKKVRSLFER